MPLRSPAFFLALALLSPLAGAAESPAKVHVATFNRLDSNRDGVLSFREFGPKHHQLSSTLRTIRKAGSRVTTAEVESFQREMFSAFDADSSDSIDLLEWQILREDPLGSISVDDWRAMPVMDLDLDGTVFFKEFRHLTSLYLTRQAFEECFSATRQAYPGSGSIGGTLIIGGGLNQVPNPIGPGSSSSGLLTLGAGAVSSISQSWLSTDSEGVRAWVQSIESSERLVVTDLVWPEWLRIHPLDSSAEIQVRLDALRERESSASRRGNTEQP